MKKQSEKESAESVAIALGLTVFQAQVLEYSLVSLYAATAWNTSQADSTFIKELMDARYKQTLGKLITDAIKKLEIPTKLKVKLEDALQKRNWVTHHFFREYGAMGFSQELQNDAAKKLNEMWPFFERVSDDINFLVNQRLKESGLSQVEINNSIQQAIESYVAC